MRRRRLRGARSPHLRGRALRRPLHARPAGRARRHLRRRRRRLRRRRRRGRRAPPTRLRRGRLRRQGERRCVDGAFADTCTPGRPAAGDATCDGVDDDCDGVADEGAVARRVTCGEGACRRDGEARCVDGAVQTDCAPAPPAGRDATCDGVDDDCDGTPDEDALPQAVRCGVGACAAVGERRCEAGAEVQRCDPGAPADADVRCDGVDEDCDGAVDEDWAPTDVLCGVGACAAIGRSACVDGARVERCAPAEPAAADPTCDGVDDDCDGLTDEDFAPPTTACGAGACARQTPTRCVDGVEADVCVPGEPTGDDADCDGVDDDCDGRTDEGFAPRPVTCGVGACAARGAVRCRAGAEVEACAPQAPWPDDVSCDGVDDDCDGRTDEDCASAAEDGGAASDGAAEVDAAPHRRDACVDSLCGAAPLDVEDRQRAEGCDCRAASDEQPGAFAALVALLALARRRRRGVRR
ncbi:MAG: hypothetical protein H6704_22035 [Myxococcales bacterium]|nr:hypothetical protein [Myxococcales bacterium]